MMTKLETMENQAKFIGSSFYKITPVDWIEVFSDENEEFSYRFNGVDYEREYIEEKIPFNSYGFEDGLKCDRGFE